jgi:hypothetical protein
MNPTGPRDDRRTSGASPAASELENPSADAGVEASGPSRAAGPPPAPPREIRRTVSRRAFTMRFGAALLAAPFAQLLLQPRRARAATGKTAKRLVVMFNPNGTFPSQWHPVGADTSFSFASGSILEPLSAYRQQLVVIRGLQFFNASNHAGGMHAMLTASGTAGDESKGMSVDQYVASRIGGTTRLKSLELGVQTSIWGAGEQTRMCYAAPDQYAPPDDDPVSVYGRIFGGGTTGGSDPTSVRRQSVIDAVKSDLTDLRSRLGTEEAKKLDQHLASVRELERSMGITACSGGTPPASIAKDQNDNFPTIGKSQLDLLVAALACGATNVATLQWSFTVSPVVFSWLGISDQHHTLSHNSDQDTAGVKKFTDTERWFAQQFAYLLDKLAATADPGGGTLLDSTLVVWAKEMGDARLHVSTDVPFVLAGSGAFETGRYLDAAGANHAHLWVSVCRAMGLNVSTFGAAAAGTGPLAGL